MIAADCQTIASKASFYVLLFALRHFAPKKEIGYFPSHFPSDRGEMGRTGFEPVKAKPEDLQSSPVGHLGICPKS
jgi:hypothetical protein